MLRNDPKQRKHNARRPDKQTPPVQDRAQHRLDGVPFDIAVFTNLTQDHLDYHGDMDAYFEAKRRLFTLHPEARAAINIDREFGAEINDFCFGSFYREPNSFGRDSG